jgi:hypothetical protein
MNSVAAARWLPRCALLVAVFSTLMREMGVLRVRRFLSNSDTDEIDIPAGREEPI